MFQEIRNSKNWKSVEKINKGWSRDTKYLIKTFDDEKLILRISDIEVYEEKKKEFEIIKKFYNLGFKMSKPIDFGTFDNNSKNYMILSWIEGEELRDVLPSLSDEEQYNLGRKAGEILKKIHSIEVHKKEIPKETKINKKLEQLKKYEQSKYKIDGDEDAIKFLKENIDMMWRIKPIYLHGDFHPGNLIYMEDKDIGVIDFNRWEIGDPYEEFYKLQGFGADISPQYAKGQIDSYFNDNIPDDFWKTQAVYVAHASLYSIIWAEKFGQEDIDGMINRFKKALIDYDNFKTIIPKWWYK